MNVEGHKGPPSIPLHYDPVVRYGYGKGTFVGVVVTLIDGCTGVGRAAYDANRC